MKTHKNTKSALKRKADTVFAAKVRALEKCELKGKDDVTCSNQLQCMHIIGRANVRLRYEPLNTICGCSGHHRYYTDRPFDFVEIVRVLFPKRYRFVMKHKEEKVKATVEYYKDIIERYS